MRVRFLMIFFFVAAFLWLVNVGAETVEDMIYFWSLTIIANIYGAAAMIERK